MKLGCSPGFIFAYFGDRATFQDFVWCIKEAARMGFQTLELEIYNEAQKEIFGSDERIRHIRDIYRSLNLEVPLFFAEHLKKDILCLDRVKRNKALEELKDVIEICKKLEMVDSVGISCGLPPELFVGRADTYIGAPPSRISLPSDLFWEDVWKAFVETIAHCAEIAKEAGMSFVIEPLPHTLVTGADSFLRLACEVSLPNLGMLLDTSHTYYHREDLPVAVEKLGSRLLNTHLNDTDGSDAYHWAPGKGKVDWADFLRALRKIGYNRPLDVEIFGKGVENIERSYIEGKAYIEEILASLGK